MIKIELRKSAQLFEKNSAFVSFNYNPKIIELIKRLPFRAYNTKTKEWEIQIDKIEFLKSQLPNETFKMNSNLEEFVAPHNCIPTNFKFKTKPYAYQYEGVEYGINSTHWLLGDMPGLGKTKQVIDIACIKKQTKNYKHCLILCGINSLKWNWYNEIHTHSNEDCTILGMRRRKSGKRYVGSTKDKLYDINYMLWKNGTNEKDEMPYFIITNIESLRSQEIAKALGKCCKDGIINIVAFDECHKCKNPSSQQSNGLLQLDKCEKIAMTGTPIMNTPLDLFIILRWLGYENHQFYHFKNHYCIMGGIGGHQIVGYKNLDQLAKQVDEIMLRRKKDEVLDLPDKIFIDEIVEMTSNQSKIYEEVEKNIRENIDKILKSNNPVASLIRLRQATGYTGILSSKYKESSKLDRMLEIVEEAVSNNDKCLIFSNWTKITDVALEMLKDYNPALVTGQVSDVGRQSQQDKFMNDDTCKVIIGSIGAMGTGLTLTAGSTVIFLDEPWTKAELDQAIDRAHRIGTKSNVKVHIIRCKDTIDERVHDLVLQKGELSDCIIDAEITQNQAKIFNYLFGVERS